LPWRSGRAFEGDLVAEGLELADVVALAAFGAVLLAADSRRLGRESEQLGLSIMKCQLLG